MCSCSDGFHHGVAKFAAVFAREKTCPSCGGHWPRRDNPDVGADSYGFGLPRCCKRDLGSFGGPVCTEEFLACVGVVEKCSLAFARAQQGFDHGDQDACGARVGGDGFIPVFCIDGPGRGKGGCVDGGVKPSVEATPAVIDGAAEVAHGIIVGDIHGGKGEVACAGEFEGFDTVIKVFQPADGAGDGDHMPATGGEGVGHGIAKAA